MSPPRPIRPNYFQADLIWWDGSFKRGVTVETDFGESFRIILIALIEFSINLKKKIRGGVGVKKK